MPEATNAQMQTYADQRLRPRAEQIRALFAACEDDVASIDDIYARAVGTNRWNDARTDPPHLLQSGNSASPDDMLNYNAAIQLLVKLKNGTFASQAEANGFAALWAVLVDACVRPIGG